MSQFHVIDDDHRRRAEISRELLSRGLHAEIYEDTQEFYDIAQATGVVLASNTLSEGIWAGVDRGAIAIPIALYSERPEIFEIVDAISSGAIDFLAWPFRSGALERLLKRLDAGASKTAEVRRRAVSLTLVRRLSAREREVLVLLAQGGSNKSIGTELGISPRTIEIHRANLMKKLEAKSTAEVVRIALHAGLDNPPNLGRSTDTDAEFDIAV